MKFSLLSSLLAFACIPALAQVGIGTTTPNSMLDVRGSLSVNFRSYATSTTTIAATDHTVVYTGTVNSTATLPTAATCAGRFYWIKNASTQAPTPVLTVATTSSQTIDGLTSWALDEPNEITCFVSNGTNWFVLNQDVAVPGSATSGGSWLQGGNQVTSSKSLGTKTNFDLPFITNNTEKMRLTTAGYLGIGLIAPAGRLHLVNQGIDAGNDYIFDDYGEGTTQGIYMTKSRGSIGSPSDLALNDQIGHLRFVPRFNGSIASGPGSSVEAFYRGNGTTGLSDLRFFTSSVERMRINENGNVAIYGGGTPAFNSTNPEKLLVDAGVTTSFNVISGKGSINNYLQFNIQNRSAEGSASSDVVASNNTGSETANFIDMGINSSGYSSTLAPILGGANTAYLYATGSNFVIGNGSTTRHLIFFTNGFELTDEKMRILNTGNIGIGVTAPADKLSVAGNVAPSADNTWTVGKSTARWTAVWAANGVIQTSDARLKTDIEPLNYGLKEVMAMKPVRYHWLASSGQPANIGLLAQDVQQLVPEVVRGDADKEMLGMNYAELVPVLINAIKEQQVEIEKIQKSIETLKNKRANP